MTRQTCANTIGEGCGRVLPLTEFHRKGKRADGTPRYHALCKVCNREKLRAWRAANPERVTAYNRRDWIVHREKRSEAHAEHYLEHADELRARERDRVAGFDDAQRDRLRTRQREWWRNRTGETRRSD
jgi:hypothetical protein